MLSSKKVDWIAYLAFQNALRLHEDAILLFNNGRFPSACFISILAQEEIGKMHILNDHSWRSGDRLNDISQIKDEDKRKAYLKELQDIEEMTIKAIYDHRLKQGHFYYNSPIEEQWVRKEMKIRKSYQDIWDGLLDRKKLNSVYVGFPKKNRKADLTARLQHPWEITNISAAQQITRVNDYLLVFGLGLRYTSFIYENEDIADELRNKRTLKKFSRSWPISGRAATKQIKTYERLLKDPIVSNSRSLV